MAYNVNNLVIWKSDLYAATGLAAEIYKWDGSTWTTIASAATGEIGQRPVLAAPGEHLCAVSFRTNVVADTTETLLSQWDGSAWQTSVIATSPGAGNLIDPTGLPAITADGDSFYIANNTLVTGAGKYFFWGENATVFQPWGIQGKVSPLVSRLFLGAVPPLEVGDGYATMFFREPHVIPGRVHRIERTMDFNSWETLGYRYAGETGGIDFTDSTAPAGKAFYRAVPLEK